MIDLRDLDLIRNPLLSKEELELMKFFVNLNNQIDHFLKEHDHITITKTYDNYSFLFSCEGEAFIIDMSENMIAPRYINSENIYQSKTPILTQALNEAQAYFKRKGCTTKSLKSIKFILED